MNENASADLSETLPLNPAEFDAALRAVGAERYHDKHPFHKLLHGGKLNKGQVQAWALNRYCYQEARAAQGRGVHQPRARPRIAARMDPPHPRS